MLECFLVLHVCSYCSCVNNYLPGHMQVLINIAKYEQHPALLQKLDFRKVLDILFWRPFRKNQNWGGGSII